LEVVLRSDETFRGDEVDVALELIDDQLEKGTASDYWFVVAELASSVVGYICFGPTPMTLSTFDLYWIVVDKRARGQGLASTLISEMERLLGEKGATGVRVETSQMEGYGAARRLYDKNGYPEVARFEDFYRPGDDLIVYYKRL
jgi:ribosomal protein S18 acetylase RimI-like enzyme